MRTTQSTTKKQSSLSSITSTFSRKTHRSVKQDIGHQIGMIVEESRIKAGLTQKQLAKKIGTSQPSIARVESGSFIPSLPFLGKIAKVLKKWITIEFREF